MTTKSKHRNPGMVCPDCGGPSTQRQTRLITSIVREVAYRCNDDACGTGFIAQVAAIRITQRSAAPNPDNHLPFAPHIRAKPANENHPTPANDERLPAATEPPMTG